MLDHSFLEVTAILVCAFLTRFIFLQFQDTDADVHLWFINFYAHSGSFVNKEVPEALNPNAYIGYPPIPHIFLAKLPPTYWVAVGKLLNIIYEALSIIILYISTQAVFSSFNMTSPSSYLSAGAMTALIYSTSPILHPLTARLRAMGGRTLSDLLILVYFITFGTAYLSNINVSKIGYILCIFVGLLTILSSQFGLQVLFFFSMGLSIYYIDWLPISLFFVFIIIGLLLKPTGIDEQLKSKLSHYQFYIKYIETQGIDYRNSPRLFFDLCLKLFTLSNKKRRINDIAKFLLYKLTPLIVAYSVPPLDIVLYWFYSKETLLEIRHNPVTNYCFAIMLVSLVTFIFTSLKPFLFLGEAERYIEHSLPFISFLFIYYLLSDVNGLEIFYSIVFLQTLLIVFNFLFLNQKQIIEQLKLEKQDEAFLATTDFINKINENRNILTIPTKLASKLVIYLSKEKFKLYFLNVFEVNQKLDHWLEYHITYTLPQPNLSHFIKKYNIDLIVFEKRAVELYQMHDIQFPISKFKIIHENSRYYIFDLADSRSKDD